MKVLTFGDVMDAGRSVFTSVAELDGEHLRVTFQGSIRIDNPYTHLEPYLAELRRTLPELPIHHTEFDFTRLRFCNSNGFYIVMDITETVYQHTDGPVLVRRLDNDDWHLETLPILLDIDEPEIAARTTFVDQREL